MTRIDYNKLPLTDGIDSSLVGLTQKSQQEIFEAVKKYYMEKQQRMITNKKSKEEILDDAAIEYSGPSEGGANKDQRLATKFVFAVRRAFRAGAEWQEKQSSTPWFSIAEGHLPPTYVKGELGNYSKGVLITDGQSVTVTHYVRTPHDLPVGWYGQNNIFFEPTHFAFINYPEK